MILTSGVNQGIEAAGGHLIMYPELMLAYLLTRMWLHIPPGSNMNLAMVNALLLKFPSLKRIRFSKTLPDPNMTPFEDNQHPLVAEVEALREVERQVQSRDNHNHNHNHKAAHTVSKNATRPSLLRHRVCVMCRWVWEM